MSIFAVFERENNVDQLWGCFTDLDKAMALLESFADGYYHVCRSEDGKIISWYNMTRDWKERTDEH